MIDFLLGVPGALKTLTDRLTATWAAKLDTLHDTRLTSTRAGYLDKLNITGNVPSATDWTPARAAKLDDNAEASNPLISPPIATGFTVGGYYLGWTVTATQLASAIAGASYDGTPGTAYVDLINITGKGVINAIQAMSGYPDTWVKLTIDGVAVAEVNLTSGKCHSFAGAVLLNASGDFVGVTYDQIPFKASLRLQIKSAAGQPVIAAWKYRRTA